jgi:hypothetical protein
MTSSESSPSVWVSQSAAAPTVNSTTLRELIDDGAPLETMIGRETDANAGVPRPNEPIGVALNSMTILRQVLGVVDDLDELHRNAAGGLVAQQLCGRSPPFPAQVTVFTRCVGAGEHSGGDLLASELPSEFGAHTPGPSSLRRNRHHR